MNVPDPVPSKPVVSAAELDFARAADLGQALLTRLGEVRERAPIAWSESAQAWLVTRQRDVLDALAGKVPVANSEKYTAKLFRSISPEEQQTCYPLITALLTGMITNTDGERHSRLRRLLMRAFNRRVVEGVRPVARAIMGEVLDSAADRRVVDFVSEIARPVTGRVILHLLGLDGSYYSRLEPWSQALGASMGAPRPGREAVDRLEQALGEMKEAFSLELGKRVRQPGEDFLSQLVLAEDNGDRLTDEEMLGTCIVTLIAGHDTTMNTMAMGAWALSEDRSARQIMSSAKDQLGAAITELMRFIGMSTIQTRLASDDFDWHGARIARGDLIFLAIAAANRDPEIVERPDTLDLGRRQSTPVTFGPGLHHCIGHLLARMQLEEFFSLFLARFPDYRVLDPAPPFTAALGFRGLARLDMELAAATA